MIVGLLINILLIAGVILGIRRLAGGSRRSGSGQGSSVRRFFQYVLCIGLVCVSAIGLSGLLARLFNQSNVISSNQVELARNVTFVVVGLPLCAVMFFWTRRKFQSDENESKSFEWDFYLTVISLTALVQCLVALRDLLNWVVGVRDFNGTSLANLLVWGAIWYVHWWLHNRFEVSTHAQGHHIIGAAIGLGISAVALSNLMRGLFDLLFQINRNDLIVKAKDPFLEATTLLLIGALTWFIYWIRKCARAERNPLWFAYVLLLGVGGGLIAAVAALSTVLYQVLVWFFGDTTSTVASEHFKGTSTGLGAALVGILIWWYHQSAIKASESGKRTEIRRIYEYLMSAIGLFASAVGLSMILVSAMEAITRKTVITGTGAFNTLLAAITVLIVGAPVWFIFWNSIQKSLSQTAKEEYNSPSRRVYLYVLFGIGGIAAVVTLLIGVFLVLDDVFSGNFALETLRRARVAVAILVSTAAISAYHWSVFKSEQEFYQSRSVGPHFVLLVGPNDPEIVRVIKEHTGGRVESWTRTDDGVGTWSQAEVIAALDSMKNESVMLLAKSDGVEVLPINRAR